MHAWNYFCLYNVYVYLVWPCTCVFVCMSVSVCVYIILMCTYIVSLLYTVDADSTLYANSGLWFWVCLSRSHGKGNKAYASEYNGTGSVTLFFRGDWYLTLTSGLVAFYSWRSRKKRWWIVEWGICSGTPETLVR